MANKKYASLNTLQTFLDNLKNLFATKTSVDELSADIDGKADASHTHVIDEVTDLQSNLDAINNTLAEKSQVQIITSDSSEMLSTLNIHRLTQEEYDQKLESGTIDETALYLTPYEEIDLSGYATIEQLGGKADTNHNHDESYDSLGSADTALESAKSYTDTKFANIPSVDAYTKAEVDTALEGKASTNHNHDSAYDTKGAADTALETAKSYTDTKTNGLITTSAVETKISTHDTSTSAHNDIRSLITELTTRLNTLADSDDTTLDQMSEIIEYIKSNKDLIDAVTTSKVNVSDIVNNLTTNVSNKPLSAAQGVAIKELIDALDAELDAKAASEHTHSISEVTNLQSSLDNKSNIGHTHTVDNITDLTVTANELNYMSGVTSNVQSQIDGKANSSHEHSATNITSGTLSSDRLPTVPVEKGGTGATTPAAALNNLGLTATANELNVMDGIAVTTAELNYVDGVTSNIQTQLNDKQPIITGGATTITTANLTANRALVSDGSGKVAISDVTSTEIGYLDGVSSNIQSQIDGKANTVHTHAISDVTNLQSSLDEKVPMTRTVNGKALSGDITLTASDVGADASGSASSALSSANTYTDNAVAQKSLVQFVIWGDDD